MQISSNVWLGLIVAGAILVALGNINYNSAKDRERGEAASVKALSLLKAELERNLAHIANYRVALPKGEIPTIGLETTAWTVVSNGGLLVQLDQGTLGKIADIYYLTGLVETYRTQLYDSSVGISSSMTNAAQVRQALSAYLNQTLDKLEPKIKDALAS